MAAGAATGGNTPTFNMPSAQETALPAPPEHVDETYTKEAAKLNHQLNTTLAGDQETFNNDKATYEYQQALLAKAEPERFAANRYRGVREGISESGINAGRISGITGDFLLKNARNLETFGERTNALNRGAANAVAGQGFDVGILAAGSNTRYLDWLLKTKPETPEATPAAAANPPIAPGFLPQPESTLPGGGYAPGNTTNVRVGANTLSARRAAAAKARRK